MSVSQQRSQELDILVEITEILTGRLPFLEKCESVLAVLARFTDSDAVFLREFDSENSTLEVIAYYFDQPPGEDLQIVTSVTADQAIKALENDSPFVIGDRSAIEAWHRGYTALGMISALVVPIHIDGELFGTLGFGSRSADQFQEEIVPVVTSIAVMVGMMVANAELQEINEVEAHIGRIVSAPLVGPDIFEMFAAQAARIIDFDHLALNSVNFKEDTFITEFLFGMGVPNYSVGKAHMLEGTALDVVARSRAGRCFNLLNDGETEPKYRLAEAFIAAGGRYLLDVPFIVGDQVIGTMGFNRSSRPFSRKDLAKAERLGNLMAGALADFKQQQYRAQAEQEISKNKAILEAEAAIGRILSAPLSRPGASEALISEIANIISLDHIVIAAVDIETEIYTTDFIEFLHDPRLMLLNITGNPYAGSITGEVVRCGTGQIIYSDDPRLVSGQLPRAKRMFDQGYKTMMAAPLVFEGKIIGTLVLLSRREKEYGEKDLAIADRIGNLLAGALATFKITAERDRAQSALSESDGRFRQIADSIRGVFWLVELDPHRLIYASPNAEEVWDRSLTDIYDDFSVIFDNIHPEDRTRIQQDSAGADRIGDLDIEYRIIKRDGSVRWIHSRGFPIKDSSGKLYRMSGIAEDITDRKLELERITEAGRLLSVGELASGVAHEINNPLAVINLYAEMLMDQDLPISVTEDLKVISAQGKRAATIVRNLLQFARKSSPKITTVDAREFIERCVELKGHDFRINNISVSTNVLLEHPDITIDEQLMTQVMVNILTNAEQACVAAHGRGSISISVKEIGGSTRISISDDGPGIPAENLLKVFDPFFTTKEVGEGTGLGLSVSYGIIAQLGGELWVESDGVSGSTFHMEVPSAVAEQP